MKNFKFGFTLAEVLITLAIIGVVAALTLPTLVANYQKKEWVTRLIKTRAELTQGFKTYLAQENSSAISQTKAWETFDAANYCGYTKPVPQSCTVIIDSLYKIFGGSKLDESELSYSIKYLDGVGRGFSKTPFGMKLKNGVIIHEFHFYKDITGGHKPGEPMQSRIGTIYVDLNGSKGPNIVGRDLFVLELSDNGDVFPGGGKELAIYYAGMDNYETKYWRTTDDIWLNCSLEWGRGEGCAGRIFETGKMDY